VAPGAVFADSEAIDARGPPEGIWPYASELKIVSAVVEGYSNREISEYFKIGENTVKGHLNNIFHKTGVSTRLDLALFAVKPGFPVKSIE
jgi:DNA-binding CsgD family transcriptional regulator